jgi:hypothetical protein
MTGGPEQTPDADRQIKCQLLQIYASIEDLQADLDRKRPLDPTFIAER